MKCQKVDDGPVVPESVLAVDVSSSYLRFLVCQRCAGIR